MKIQTHMLGNTRVGRFSDLKTIGEKAVVQEAIDKGYVVGKRDLIVNMIGGVLKSMAAGVKTDGCGRKIDGVLSLNAYPKCSLEDNTAPVSKDNVRVRLVARLLKDCQINSDDWSFTIEGTVGTLTINSITTGEAMGEVRMNEQIQINGMDLDMSATDTVEWAVPELGKFGTVPTASITSELTRITLAADTLAELAALEYDGKEITFTVKIGNKKAVKTAVLRG